MTDVSNPGSKDGADGQAPGQVGANGSAGYNAVVVNTPETRGPTDADDPVNSGTAGLSAANSPTPGPADGGNGGNGFGAGNPFTTGTASGAGGDGGSAYSKVVTNAAYSPSDHSKSASATANAYGGNGGNGGKPGFSTPATTTSPKSAKGGKGGNGGVTTAFAQSTNSGQANVVANAMAIGGSGGSSYYGSGGTGATVTSTAIATAQAAGYSATATAMAVGGSGGESTSGAGGVGASVTMTNAAAGATNGGELQLFQNAEGGNGGASVGGAAGAAGNATSILTLNDTAGKNPNGGSGSTALVSAQIVGYSSAVGGYGGGAYDGTTTATAGGTATSTVTLTGVSLQFTSTALGGHGGNGQFPQIGAYSSPGGNSGGAGGKGTASISGTTTTPTATNPPVVGFGSELVAFAKGGGGGTGAYTFAQTGEAAFVAGGSGGVGGAAAASLTGNVASVTGNLNHDTYGQVFDDIYQSGSQGGDGGAAYGSGKKGGVGGIATATASVTGKSAVASNVEVGISGQGGHGGDGDLGASGGAGAATTLSTTISSGLATNGTVYFGERATGGGGGSSAGGTTGAGGAASSTASITDATGDSIVGGTQALGGSGGSGTDIKLRAATGSTYSFKYSAGGAGGNATSSATAVGKIDTTDTNLSAEVAGGLNLPGWGSLAVGGSGGSAQGATGGAGGTGTATATGTSSVTASTIGAQARGGDGGNVVIGNLGNNATGSGGAGGAATATAKGTTSAITAMPPDRAAAQPLPGQRFGYFDIGVSALANGGQGGSGVGASKSGGVGGAATATATGISSVSGKKTTQVVNNQYVSIPGSVVQAGAYAYGGIGGYGDDGAVGGAGGNATVNSPTGSIANGGILALKGKTIAGSGGDSASAAGGAGGTATTTLTIANAGYTGAYAYSKGGQGGSGATGGKGGAATSTLTIKATRAASYYGGFGGRTSLNGPIVPGVTGDAIAVGGGGGVGLPGNAAPLGGNATATTKVTGPGYVAAYADATSGAGGLLSATNNNLAGIQQIGGTATANATGVGYKGTVEGDADSGTLAGVVTDISAQATAQIFGAFNTTGNTVAASTAVTLTEIAFNAAVPAVSTSYQSIASVVAAPTVATVQSSILAKNNAIQAKFANPATATYFATGEIGGSYDTAGKGTETQTQTLDFKINPNALPAGDQGHLILGLFNGTTPPTTMGLSFTVSINNTTKFSSSTAAGLFSNDAIDLGAIGNSPIDVKITMSETFTAAGSFFGEFLLGDPPAATDSHVGALASALFDGYFGSSGTDAGAGSHAASISPPTVTANADLIGTHHTHA